MRIALIVPGFSADERDWCIPALLNLARALAREHAVQVIALRYPHRRGPYRVHGVPVYALGGALAAGAARGPLLARALAQVVAHGRFDVVHGFWADEPGALAVLAGRITRARAVVSVMGGELVGLREIGYGGQLSRLNRLLCGLSLRGADAALVGSPYLAGIARRRVPLHRLHVAPLGVDARMFRATDGGAAAEPLEGAPALLHVASLVPVKDQATLLRAFARLSAALPAARLHIVGAGPLLGALRGLAGELQIEGRISWHGALAHERLPALYRAADLHMLTSRYESQCLATLEAAACGTPTVGTAVGLLPSQPALGVAVPVGDATALAEATLALLRDERRRRGLSDASRALASRRYGLARTTADLVALYASL
jgi:glycosyltransferase involved in cell wall biosynthesis